MNTLYSRITHKRTDEPGVVPTIPLTTDHTDGTWLDTDIYDGEMFINSADRRVWVRMGNRIIDVPLWQVELDIFNAWYVPTAGDMEVIFTEIISSGLGNFQTDTYWTSTDYSATQAYVYDVDVGTVSILGKETEHLVRPVRAFLDTPFKWSVGMTGPAEGYIYYVFPVGDSVSIYLEVGNEDISTNVWTDTQEFLNTLYPALAAGENHITILGSSASFGASFDADGYVYEVLLNTITPNGDRQVNPAGVVGLQEHYDNLDIHFELNDTLSSTQSVYSSSKIEEIITGPGYAIGVETLTLLETGWTVSASPWNYEQGLTVSGVDVTTVNLISTEKALDGLNWAEAQIFGEVTGDDEMIFKCMVLPEDDIDFKVVIFNGE